MPITGSSSGGGFGQSPIETPKPKFGGAASNVSDIGKFTIDVTKPSESLTKGAEGVVGLAQGVGKAAVSVIENLPILGLVTKPVIGAVGSVVDATVGKGVNAISNTVIGEVASKGLNTAAEVAFAPIGAGLKLLTAPGEFVARRIAAARTLNTIEGKNDLITALFGNAPDSVKNQYKSGQSIDEIAESFVGQFGVGPAQQGAFSTNAFANLAWTILLDPVNLIPISKPFTIASKAAKLDGITSGAIKAAANGLRADAKAAKAAGKPEVAKRLLAQAAEREADAVLIEKYAWAGKLYKNTWGKVTNSWSKLTGGSIARHLAQETFRVVGTDEAVSFLDDAAVEIGKGQVDEALGNAALTAANANKAAVMDVIVNSQRNVSQASAQNIVKTVHAAIQAGTKGADLLAIKYGDDLTLGDFLKSAGYRDADAIALVGKVEGEFVDGAKAFFSKDSVKATIGELTDVLQKIDVKARPDFYVNAGAALGKSNLQFAVDSGIDLMQRSKVVLQRFADNAELGVPYLSRMLQHGFKMSEAAATKLATAQFAKHAGDPRKLMNVLELGRMTSFGRSMREVAELRASQAIEVEKLAKAGAKREALVARTYFKGLDPERAAASAKLYDAMAQASAKRQGISVESWYFNNTFGISKLSDNNAAMSIVDELYAKSEATKAAFANAVTSEELLEVAKIVKPTKRMIEAGLGDQLPVKIIETPSGKMALPGGLEALDSAEPYNIIDEIILGSQPNRVFDALPGDVRVKIHAKMTASKKIDMQDPAEVVNRIIFAIMSPKRALSENAAVYQILRVRDLDDLRAFSAKWRDRLLSGDESEVGLEMVKDFGLSATEGGMANQLARAGKIMLYAAENPEFFKLKPGETMNQFSERITLLGGAGLKVGVFATEMMDTAAASIGAIDSQMSVVIFKWADEVGLLDQLVADLRKADPKVAATYLDGYTATKGGKSVPVKGMLEVLENEKAGILAGGQNATGKAISLGPKGIDAADVSEYIKQSAREIPDYARASGPPQVATIRGSIFEVLLKYVDDMAVDASKNARTALKGKAYPGLENLSGAQKQWFFWDIIRQQFEPHFWLAKGVNKMAKPSPDDIKRALKAVKQAGGVQRAVSREGLDINIMAEFLEKRGDDVLGATRFDRKGRSAIELFKGADITTAIHEIGHVARRQMDTQDRRVMQAIYGINDEWTVEAEERFAKDFTEYLYTGKAPVRELNDLFAKIRQWMTELWAKVSGDKTITINPEARGVFDRLLSHNTVSDVPDADTWSRLTLISDRSLTMQARDRILQAVNQLLGEGDGSEVLLPVSDAKAPLLQRIDDGLVSEGGGATFNPIRGTTREIGKDKVFQVSPYKTREVSFTGTDRQRFLTDKKFQRQVMVKFLEDNEDLLALDNHYIGLYDNTDTGTYFIDVSKSYDSAQDAIEAGVRAGQESVFGLGSKNGTMIYLDTPLGRIGAEAANDKVIRHAGEVPGLDGLSKAAPDEKVVEDALRPIANELISKYDDVSTIFYNKGASALDVIEWVRNHPEIAVRELTETEARLLPDAFKAKQAEIARGGYRYAIAPKGGVIERTAIVIDGFGRERITTNANPFVDMLDTVAINEIDELAGGFSKRPTLLNRFQDLMTYQYGPDVIRNAYIERFTTLIMGKAKISQRDALTIMSRVNNLASRKQTTVRGLWFERDQVETIFRDVLGDVEFFKYIENNDPLTDLFEAARGDLSVVGLAPAASGRAKVWRPVLGAITDRAYPLFRFGKGNPIFRQLLEPIETRLMKLVYDVKADIADDFLGGRPSTLIRRVTIDPRGAQREIAESVFYDQEKNAVATLIATKEAPELAEQVSRVARARKLISDGKWAVLNPEDYKTISRDMMASEFAVEKFTDLLSKAAPDAYTHLSEGGVLSGRQVMAMILEDAMVASSPEALTRALKTGERATLGLWERALSETGMPANKARDIAAATYGVFTDAMIRGTRTADRYQYFSAYRSWFERSINHPFLGVYPYSYMTQKAIPWMLRALFAPKIGGYVRPGFGFINYMRVQEYLAVDANTDRSFMTTIAEMRPVWYALNIMIPATPQNMGFALPSYVRQGILRPAAEGQAIDFEQLSKVPGMIGETVVRGTALGQAGSFLGAAGAFGESVQQELEGIQGQVNKFLP